MKKPNFFVIGAPKCGTTSVATWLAHHPKVFMCTPKEPFFFCRDILANRFADNWDDYCKLFKMARESHLAIGEASTSYLRSREAVPSILKKMPEARFVVCLRNPIEMIASVHSQLVSGVREDVRDLKTALALEPMRRRGKRLPPNTREPKDLLYTNTCALGSQLLWLYERVDRSYVHLIFIDDLRADPGSVWLGLQDFLGIPDDGRTNFTTENARAVPRSVVASRILRNLHLAKNRVMPGRSLGFGASIGRALKRGASSDEMIIPVALRTDLAGLFADEIDTMGRLTGRDLTAWKNGGT